MSDLRPCPFCGNEYNQGHKPSCYFRMRGKGGEFRETSWQSRPIEDKLDMALDAEIAMSLERLRIINELRNKLDIAVEALMVIARAGTNDNPKWMIAEKALKQLEGDHNVRLLQTNEYGIG